MKTILTDRALKAMKPAAPGTRKMIWDSAVPSFGVRVSERGKLTFIVMRRLQGKLVRRMLGQYPIMPLAAAREAALEALRDLESKRKRLSGARKPSARPIPLPRLPRISLLGMCASCVLATRPRHQSGVN